MSGQKIKVETSVHKPMDQVWEKFTVPAHIMVWNSASDDWYTPSAVNDLRTGGCFNYRMSARDGSSGFDFAGTYDDVVPGKRISYTLGDDRKVMIEFTEGYGSVKIIETFDAENTYSLEQQRDGWQSILDHFKRYTESV